MDILDILLQASFWTAAIRIASPLIFAALGELICERAGVLNLGIEGIMVVGAFAGWLTVYLGGGLWFGVAVAMLSGMAFGLVHGVLTVPFGRWSFTARPWALPCAQRAKTRPRSRRRASAFPPSASARSWSAAGSWPWAGRF